MKYKRINLLICPDDYVKYKQIAEDKQTQAATLNRQVLREYLTKNYAQLELFKPAIKSKRGRK